MKYIKLYEDFNDVKKYLDNVIDFELIETVKDLFEFEYFDKDENFYLHSYVYSLLPPVGSYDINFSFFKNSKHILIYDSMFTKGYNSSNYNHLFNKYPEDLQYVKKENLVYNFYITGDSNHLKKESDELINKIIEIYPDIKLVAW